MAAVYQTEIADSAYKYQKAIDEKEKTIVGVNAFQSEEQVSQELMQVNESIRTEQTQRLNALRKSRDAEAVQHSLRDLHAAAKGTDNVIPHILEAVEAYSTIGEISDVLREVWGEYNS